MPIQIRVYDDKIVIWNQGQLPDNWTVAELLQAHPSVPYNTAIANVLFRAGLIEAWGSGILRMINDCEKVNTPIPIFKYDFSGFIIEFDAKINIKSGEMSGEIIKLMKKNPKIRISQLAEALNTTSRTVERCIKELKLQNKLVRQGSTKSGIWVVM